jgi:hypothetical protein
MIQSIALFFAEATCRPSLAKLTLARLSTS